MNYYINGEIGYEFTAEKLQKEWDEKITDVYINSIGGSVWEGIAIYNFLKEKNINTHTNGVVASIASIIFLAGKERFASPYDDFLIHLPFSFGGGNADDLEKQASELRKIENKLAKIYEAETSLTYDQAIEQMKKEDFVSPDWLLENGFVNEIIEIKAVAKIINKDKNMSETILTDKDKSWFESKLSAFAKIFMPKNIIVQDMDGVEIEFPDVPEGEVPKVGDKGNVAGAPAEGEYTMPSGEVYVFTGGELTEIKPVEDEDDVETLKAEIERLKAENDELKNEVQNSAEQIEVKENSLKQIRNEFTSLQAEIREAFKYDPKAEQKPKASRVIK